MVIFHSYLSVPEANHPFLPVKNLLRDAVNYLHKENRTFEAAKMLARPRPWDGGWPMVKFHDFHDFHEFSTENRSWLKHHELITF